MIKNTFILAAVTLVLGAAAANAATVNGTNYNLDTLTHKPITLSTGASLTSGGVIQIGSFTSTGPALDALISGLTSPAGLSALLADFITFGGTTSVGGLGAGFEGIYDIAAEVVPFSAGNPLIGKSIYTLIGNNATLAGSTELAIVQDNQAFDVDAPLFVAGASLLETTNVFRFGNGSGPTLTTNAAFPAAASLQLAAIPEPMSAALLLSGLALVVRRRRA
jgi:hypothetical protein